MVTSHAAAAAHTPLARPGVVAAAVCSTSPPLSEDPVDAALTVRSACRSPLRAQLRAWVSALTLVTGHAKDAGVARSWAVQLVLCAVVRAACSLVKMRVNEASVVQQNLGQFRAFVRTQGKQLTLAVFLSVLSNWITFSQQQLALQWRSGLTRHLHDLYFRGNSFYNVAQGGASTGAILDADVRITEDVPKLSASLASLVVMMANGCLDIAIFSVVLARSGRMGQFLGIVAQLYVVAVYCANNYFVPVDYRGITKDVSVASSRLQQDLSRFETHSSTICALQGGALESQNLRCRFAEAVRAKMSFFSAQHLNESVLYFFTTSTFDRTPLFWCSFLYFSSAGLQMLVRHRAGAMPLLDRTVSSAELAKGWGLVIRYHGSVVSIWLGAVTVAQALQEVLLNHSAIERIRSLSARLEAQAEHAAVVRRPAPSAADGDDDAGTIRFSDVHIQTPTGLDLVRILSFTLHWGESLLLTGHNGVGKSSVVRCLGGLWDPAAGSIRSPGLAGSGRLREVYYVPQRPYNAVGTLAEQLCYPEAPPTSLLDKGELRKWLGYVDLGYLTEGRDLLTFETDWQSELSLGEQQRLGILRLFYHRPKFAVLDECTSAVTGEVEQRLYDLCERLQISCITIAHRPALERYHQRMLMLTGRPSDADGGFRLSALTGARPPLPREARAKDVDVHAVIAEYFSHRGLKLRNSPSFSDGLFDRRARKLSAVTARHELQQEGWAPSASSSAPALAAQPQGCHVHSPLPNLRAILQLGLSTRSSRWRALALVFCTLLRTDLYWRVWVSVGRVILGSIVMDSALLRRGLLRNAASVVALFGTDRAIRHLSQQLVVQIWRSLAEQVHTLFMKGGVLHYAMSSRPASVTNAAGGAADTLAFSEALLSMVHDSAKPLCIGTCLLARALFRDGRSVVLAALVMLGIHKLSAICLAPNIRELTRKAAALEAKLRTLHARFRQNLEPIAFSGGGKAERRAVDACYAEIEEHAVRGVRDGLVYQTVSTFLLWGDMLPLSIMRALSAIHVWKNSNRLQGCGLSPSQFEDMWYYDNATKLSFSTLSKIALLPDKLAHLEGLAQGINELLTGLAAAAARVPPSAERPALPRTGGCINVDVVAAAEAVALPPPVLAVDGLDVLSPHGHVLAVKISFEVAAGKALLVTGPNASGKSLLGGVLAGLWPSSGGSVSLGGQLLGFCRPHPQDLLMVPQRPYLAPGGLAGNVCYPSLYSVAAEKQVHGCLQAVGLDHLVGRYGLEGCPDTPWDDVLSGGEQQRLCLARCLFHRPAFALLDECTSMVSQDAEVHLYSSVERRGVVPVTFSQRLVLPEHHQQELKLGEETDEGWSLHVMPVADG